MEIPYFGQFSVHNDLINFDSLSEIYFLLLNGLLYLLLFSGEQTYLILIPYLRNIDPILRKKSQIHSSMTILINSYDKIQKEIIIINCQSCNCKLIQDQIYINALCNFSLHSSVLETFALDHSIYVTL